MFQRNSQYRSTSGSVTRHAILSHFKRSTSKEQQLLQTDQPEVSEFTVKESAFFRDTRLRCSTGSIGNQLRDKCVICGFTVKSRDRIRIGSIVYHQTCFKCRRCESALDPKEYAVWPRKGMEEPLYCDTHRRPLGPNDTETLDLFDLIARTQNSRIDDQRCELPGYIQKARSVSHLAAEVSQISDCDRVKEMMKGKGPYQQVIQPLSGGYWIDGFIDRQQSDSDNMLRTAVLDSSEYELLKSDAVNYYKQYFLTQEHQNYIGQDDVHGPVIISIRREVRENVGKLYRTIVRTKATTVHELLRSEGTAEPSVGALTKLCNDSISTTKYYPVTSLEASRLISEFDDRFLNRNFKFGVIYQAKGQVTEEQLLSNNVTTPALAEFLEQIGSKVNLQGFDGFRGGLDTIKGQTGAESIHTDYEGREIMFHISTMLPYTEGDGQQLQRKRHIGNDIVAVVFQEESTPYIPNAITSQFLHAYIIVQPVEPCTSNTRYKISVAARSDVPRIFGPMIPKARVVRKDQLRDFLLTKLLNAEYACHSAPQFQQKMERTRTAYLSELYDELLKSTLLSWVGVNPAAGEKTAISIFDSFKRMALKRISDNPLAYKRSTSTLSPSASDGSKTPTPEHKIQKLPYSIKKTHSDTPLSVQTSWERSATSPHQRAWPENASLGSFRSQGSYRIEQDNCSEHSEQNSERNSESPQDSQRRGVKIHINGRSSPASLGSFGVDDEEAFAAHDDSDTGVGSMSPVETPSGTWESRLPQSKTFSSRETDPSRSTAECSACTTCDPDLDYVALLKKEILDLRKAKSAMTKEITAMKTELSESSQRDKNYKADLREKTKQNLRLQHQIDDLRLQSQSYRTELSRLQSTVAGMEREEIV